MVNALIFARFHTGQILYIYRDLCISCGSHKVLTFAIFCRYGPVQSVKSLPCKDGKEGEMAGLSVSAVTVAFMDIKSACKALQTAHKLDER